MPNNFHREAERLAAEAEALTRQGDRSAAQHTYAAAAAQERQALALVPPEKPRSRTILAVSLASLLYKASRLEEAESLIYALLSDANLLPFGRVQLKELLQVVFDEQSLPKGYRYSKEELIVTLRGAQIGSGTAPLDLVLQKGADLKSYTVRAAEFRGNFPFRRRGAPPAAVSEALLARATQPVASSYRFAIRFVEPAQLDLLQPPRIKAEEVSDTIFSFFRLVTAGTQDSVERLRQLVPDDDYRKAMLKLARNVVPTETGLSEIEITRSRGTARGGAALERFALRRDSKFALNAAIEFERPKPKSKPRSYVGVLRALHLDKRWLEIQTKDGGVIHWTTPADVLDDVVGPMVNRLVRIRGHVDVKGGKDHFCLDDIELEGD